MVLAERAWGREQQKHQEEWVLSPFSLPPSTGTWAVPCGSRLLACLQAQCYSWGDVLSSVCTMRSEARPHQPDLCTTVTGLLPLSLAQPSHNGTLHFCVLQPPPTSSTARGARQSSTEPAWLFFSEKGQNLRFPFRSFRPKQSSAKCPSEAAHSGVMETNPSHSNATA